MNPVTGEKQVDINGSKYVLRFDWKAIAEMEHKYGEAPNMLDTDVVAGIAEIGFRRAHPDMTADKIIDQSPPLVPFAKAVQDALQWAYFGPEAVPDTPKDEGKKKAPRAAAGLWMRLKGLFRRGSAPSSSGS